MGTKMIAVAGMDEIPTCMDCRFRWPGDRGTYCLALSHKIPRGWWYLHHIVVAEHASYRRWREPACPLVIVEVAEDAFWCQESEDVVSCSKCDGCFSEAFIHDIADYGNTYPRYCPTCGARMANWETGEDPDEKEDI